MSQMFEATPHNLSEIGGQNVRLNEGEGVLYVKFVAFTPQTLRENRNLPALVAGQPAYVYAGKLDDIRQRLIESFDQMAETYRVAVEEDNTRSIK